MSYDDSDWEDDEEQSTEVGSEDDGSGGYNLSAGELPISEENLRSFTSACRRAGLSRNQAEDLLGWHLDRFREGEGNDAANEKRILAGWKDDLRHDHDFGGPRYQQTIENARRALEIYDTNGELRQLLKQTKFQHNPAVIKVLATVGKELGERGIRSRDDRSLAARMYAGM